MTFRKVMLTLHLVGGLIAAVTLLLLGGSGSLLVFENEINQWLNRDLCRVEPSGARLPLNELILKTEERHAGYKVANLIMPLDSSTAFTASMRPTGVGHGVSYSVNQYTGAELGSLTRINPFTQKLHQFHTNLLLGPPGKTITVVSAMFLFGLSLSGLILWWPRKILKTSGASAAGKINFELHNFLGFYSSIFMLVFATTGIVIHWDNDLMEVINRWQKTPARDLKAHSSAQGGPKLNAEELSAIASKAVPGASVISLLGLGANAPVRITMKFPEDGTPSGRTNLYVQPVTGEIISMETSRTGPLGMRIAKLWNREIHTGDIGGLPTRVLASLASFTLPVLAITGPFIWIGRLRKKGRRLNEIGTKE